MGRMLLFLVIGMGALFAIANLNMTQSNVRVMDSSIDKFERTQARNIAASGIEKAVMEINVDTTWSGISNFAIASGTLDVAVVNTLSEYPSGPNMGLIGRKEITSTGTFNNEVVTIQAVIQIGSASSVPGFLNYAVASGQDFEISGSFDIIDDNNPAWNANVHTNGDMIVSGNGYSVEGFGTYAGSMTSGSGGGKGKGGGSVHNNFVPNDNPDGLSSAYQAGEIEIPEFDAESYISIATNVTSGDLNLSGAIDLGTAQNPVIWYIDGDLDFHGSTTGYGVFIVTGDVYFHGNSNVTSVDPNGSNLAFYSGGSIDIHGNTNVYGQMFAEEDIISHGNFDLYGSMTARGEVDLQGGGTVHYRPANPDLTDPVWGTGGPSRAVITSYYE